INPIAKRSIAAETLCRKRQSVASQYISLPIGGRFASLAKISFACGGRGGGGGCDDGLPFLVSIQEGGPALSSAKLTNQHGHAGSQVVRQRGGVGRDATAALGATDFETDDAERSSPGSRCTRGARSGQSPLVVLRDDPVIPGGRSVEQVGCN